MAKLTLKYFKERVIDLMHDTVTLLNDNKGLGIRFYPEDASADERKDGSYFCECHVIWPDGVKGRTLINDSIIKAPYEHIGTMSMPSKQRAELRSLKDKLTDFEFSIVCLATELYFYGRRTGHIESKN